MTGPQIAVTDLSKQKVATLYPGIRPLVFRILQDILTVSKYAMHVTDAMRSFDEQLAAYSKGRTLVNGVWQVTDSGDIVTNAKPGLSWHSYGLAFDCAWSGPDPYLEALERKDKGTAALLWKTYGDVVKSHGLRWGGDFTLLNGVHDKPHGELTYGLSISDAVELHQHGGLDAVWAHCDKVRGVPLGQDWKPGSA